MTTKPPLRPAIPIDVELATPVPEEMTELEEKKREAEIDEKSGKAKKPAGD